MQFSQISLHYLLRKLILLLCDWQQRCLQKISFITLLQSLSHVPDKTELSTFHHILVKFSSSIRRQKTKSRFIAEHNLVNLIPNSTDTHVRDIYSNQSVTFLKNRWNSRNHLQLVHLFTINMVIKVVKRIK